jgi:hypothetical protein
MERKLRKTLRKWVPRIDCIQSLMRFWKQLLVFWPSEALSSEEGTWHQNGHRAVVWSLAI